MKIYIAGVSSEQQHVRTIFSFVNFDKEETDTVAHLAGKPGFVARIELVDSFLESDCDAIILVDMDMVLPMDGLTKLRAHDLDMVTGHYFVRKTNPLMSVCQIVKDGWQIPLVDVPDTGLHEISSTGFGFVLLKREVIEAVAKVPNITHPIAPGPCSEQKQGAIFGQDIRFFYYANKLGYKLWLDADVECKHATTVYTSKKLYGILRPHQTDAWKKEWKGLKCLQESIIKDASKNWKNYAQK
jgi:hypothetical protein